MTVQNIAVVVVRQEGAMLCANDAIKNSMWLQVTPLPFDNYEVAMKQENAGYLVTMERIYHANAEPLETE